MIRLFLGLALEPALADRLALMGAGVPGARWVEARNLHVTLRFVGEVDEGAAQDLHDALAEISAPGFELELNGLGTFGGRQAHTLYAAVERTPALVHLRDKVESACVRSGLAPEPRKFTPHVTLARLKDAPTGRVQEFITRFSPFHAGPVAVDSFVLFRSHLSRGGAEYEAVAEYGLN